MDLQQRYDRLLAEFQVHLFTSRILRIGPNWHGLTIRSSFWRLYVNSRASASICVAGKEYPLRAGRILLVPAWLSFQTQLRRPADHYYLHFDLAGLPPQLVQRHFATPLRVRPSSTGTGLLRDWMKDLNRGAMPGLAQAFRAKALLHWALARMVEALPPTTRAAVGRYYTSNAAILPALEFIAEHLHEPIRNTTLARRCHLSADHFIRRFRALTGQTPAQFVADARVKQAAQALFFTADSIEEIAARLGFKDRFYFSRVFARRMGMPPAAWRKANRL